MFLRASSPVDDQPDNKQEEHMEEMKKNRGDIRSEGSLGRRDLMKLGAGAGVGLVLGQVLNIEGVAAAAKPETGELAAATKPVISAASSLSAFPQALTTDDQPTPLPPWGSLPNPTGGRGAARSLRVSRAGFKVTGNRAFGMAPYDDITRQVLEYAETMWNTPLSDAVTAAVNDLMVDALASAIAGFESDAVRATARVSSQAMGTTLKSTVWGYGLSTTPELATHTNSSAIRHTDWSDNGLGGTHFSDSVPGVVSMAEAFHCSGMDVLKAVTLTYELIGAFQSAPGSAASVWDTIYVGPSACIAIGKMLKMNDDQLANAYSLSLTTHLENNTSHSSGPLSMMKACHNADTVKGAVYSILLARAGMTGPPAPFQGTKGIFDVMANGGFKLVLPCPALNATTNLPRYPFYRPGMMVVEGVQVKRFPAEAGFQAVIRILPELGKFANKAEDIDSITIEMGAFGEIGDAAKFDPQNEETADHSVPYVIARGLMDGDIFLSSYTRDKFTDPAVRALMEKISVHEVPGIPGSPRITIKKTSGETKTMETQPLVRLTHEEVVAKYNRICDYKKVNPAQRDRMREQWLNLKDVKDMGDAVKMVAKYGAPRPLSDRKATT
jgi:2-methylcitrate dehydratase